MTNCLIVLSRIRIIMHTKYAYALHFNVCQFFHSILFHILRCFFLSNMHKAKTIVQTSRNVRETEKSAERFGVDIYSRNIDQQRHVIASHHSVSNANNNNAAMHNIFCLCLFNEMFLFFL